MSEFTVATNEADGSTYIYRGNFSVKAGSTHVVQWRSDANTPRQGWIIRDPNPADKENFVKAMTALRDACAEVLDAEAPKDEKDEDLLKATW